MAYGAIGCFIGYMLRIEPDMWLLSIGLVNVPFYCMEIRHSFFKDIVMSVGEISSVEVELIYTIVFLIIYACGGDCVDRSTADLTGFAIMGGIKLKTALVIFTFCLEALFIVDNLKESISKDPKTTFRYFSPVLIMAFFGFLSSYNPSFYEETVIMNYNYQMVFTLIVFKLMVHNMTGKPFEVLHWQYIYLILPFIAYNVFNVSVQTELYITRACAICSFIEFFYNIYCISRQYIKTEEINFFTIKE